jgi:chromosome segregation ATPase
MNTPDVVQRLQETVKNVKIELGNFKFITGEDARNTKGNPVDLPALWVEFMDKQLQKFTEYGTTFVKDQVDFALPKYKAHLEDLRRAEKRILDEEASRNTPKGKAAIESRAKEHNALVDRLPALKTALSQAETKLETAKKAVEAAKKAVDNAPAANKSSLMADQRAKKKVKIQAAAAHYKALSAKGRQERDIIKLRQTDLAALIKDVEADIKQMTDYRTAAVAMKAPKAE